MQIAILSLQADNNYHFSASDSPPLLQPHASFPPSWFRYRKLDSHQVWSSRFSVPNPFFCLAAKFAGKAQSALRSRESPTKSQIVRAKNTSSNTLNFLIIYLNHQNIQIPVSMKKARYMFLNSEYFYLTRFQKPLNQESELGAFIFQNFAKLYFHPFSVIFFKDTPTKYCFQFKVPKFSVILTRTVFVFSHTFSNIQRIFTKTPHFLTSFRVTVWSEAKTRLNRG